MSAGLMPISPTQSRWTAFPWFVASLLIVAGFLMTSLRAPLWYDEANYLTLAEAIRHTGYPIRFWDPYTPKLFANSPPAIIYLIAFLSRRVSHDVAVLRLIFVALFGVAPFVFLAVRAARNGESLFAVAVAAVYAACSGFFVMEFIQVRFDLALACESCVAVALFASATSQRRGRRSGVVLALLFGVSALAILTKFQAVCITAALLLDGMLGYISSPRRPVPWLALFSHLAGMAAGLLVLVAWASLSDYGSGSAALSGALKSNIFDRILPGHDLGGEAVVLVSVARRIAAITLLPVTMLLIANGLGKIDWNDGLLRLFAVLAAVVVAFNLAVHRMPGAGSFYMVQAAIPLGYVVGRSLSRCLRSLGARLLHSYSRFCSLPTAFSTDRT